MASIGSIPGMLNPAVQDTTFLRERRVDSMLDLWRAGGFERPSHFEVTWPNGDTAALNIAPGGFSVVVTIKESEEEG